MIFKGSFKYKTYFYALYHSLKQGCVVSSIFSAVLLVLLPLSTSAIPDISIFNLNYTHNQMLYRFNYEFLTPVINGIIIVFGLCMALVLFNYMLTKKTSDFYFSLGISRKKIFLLRLSAGFMHIFLSIIIAIGISLLLNIFAFSSYSDVFEMMKSALYLMFGYTLLAVVSFILCALICCMVGTIMESVIFSVIILTIPSVIIYSVNLLTKHFLFGSSFGVLYSTGFEQVSESLLWKFSKINPILFFYNSSSEFSSKYVTFQNTDTVHMQFVTLIIWLVVSIALIFLSLHVLSIRKAEIAGIAGKNLYLQRICSFSPSFLGYSITAEAASSINMPVALILASIVFYLIHTVFYILFERNYSFVFKRTKQSLFPLGICLCVTIMFITGFLGFSKRIPSSDEVLYATMTYTGSPNYLNSEVKGTGDSHSYYLISSYKFEDKDDINLIESLHKNIIDTGKSVLETDANNFENTSIPYDISITYTLKNGKTLSRYYNSITMSNLSKMLEVDTTTKVKKEMSNALLGDHNDTGQYWAPGAYKDGVIYLNNIWYTNPVKLNLNDDERATLLKCLTEDVINQSIDERYFPHSQPMGVLMFTLSDDNDSMSFSYSLDNTLVYITPSFTNTIIFMETKGLMNNFSYELKIDSISFEKYDPYEGINKYIPQSPFFMGYISDDPNEFIIRKDFGKDFVVDDPERIKQLSYLLQNNYYMSRGGYLACVKIAGEDKYIYKFLPLQDAPNYVIQGSK